MKRRICLLLFFVAPLFICAQNKYLEDFDFFWKTVSEEYCYFNKKQTDWDKVKEIYRSRIESATNRDQFVSILEKALNEIYDHHAILNTNTDSSNRLVPSGTDIWAEYINGKPTIIELRKGFGAEAADITIGMEVIAINDIPVAQAVARLLPRSLKQADTESKNFALRQALAGDHIAARKLTLKYKGKTSDYYPDKNGMQLEHIHHDTRIESKLIGKTGYIRINDCLYNNDLIPDFDSVMQTMKQTSSLILDFRETASGGNSSVAKAILGWFITKETFYQKHEYYAEERESGIKRSWMEIVSPRPDKYYDKPLVILCDHWTASMGEGIVVGFDALKRPNTKVIGTAMAQLNGAVYSFEMPNSKIHFSFPAERLYHVNGLPRELYKPAVIVDPINKSQDYFIASALTWLKTVK